MKSAYLLAFACGALTLGVTASAHHSFAATYLINEEQTVEGTLVAFLYRNPHAFLHLNVTDESGETVRWAVEWGGATSLTGQNVTRDTLKPGDQVVIMGNPGRDPQDHRLRLQSIERTSDGWSWSGDFD